MTVKVGDRIPDVELKMVTEHGAETVRTGDLLGKGTMLADGNGELARAMGVEIDLSGGGLGTRNRRYAAVWDDGVVTHLALEEGTGLEVSTAEGVLSALS